MKKGAYERGRLVREGYLLDKETNQEGGQIKEGRANKEEGLGLQQHSW